jgi:sec-independent protein translocase protein TatB
MFDIGWGELLVIGIVALVVIGPKELPGVLRMAGQWMGKIRRMASEFQNQFQEAMREAEMADLKKQVDEMSKAATDLPHFDPLETARREMQGAIEGKREAPAVVAANTSPPAEQADAAARDAAASLPAETPPRSDDRADAFGAADVDAAALATLDLPAAAPPPPVSEQDLRDPPPPAAPRPPGGAA